MDQIQFNESDTFEDLFDISKGFTQVPAYIIIYVLIYALASFIGTFGNALVIIATIVSKTLRHSRNVFIASLAAADFMVSAISMPASIAGVLLGKKWYEEKSGLCTFTAIVCAPGCVASMHSIAWIAISRYYYIGKYQWYNVYFTSKRITLYVIFIWLFSFLVHIPNHLGWGKIRYSFMLRFCATDTDLFSYAWLYAGSLVLAIVLAFVFYLKIYLVLRKSTLSKALITGHKQDDNHDTNSLSDEIKILKTSFKIFILFLVTWSPLCILLLIHMGDRVPPWVYLYAALAAHANSTLNFLIYFIENDMFRQAIKEMIYKIIKKPIKVHDINKTHRVSMASTQIKL